MGEVVELGRHRLLCGDSTNESDVAKLFDGEKVDLLLTDPPYGVAAVESKKSLNKRHKKIENDHLQSDEEYLNFSNNWLNPITPYLNEKNAFYIFNSDKMLFPLREALIESGFKFSQLLVWVKTGAVLGRLKYLPQHELIAYDWRGKSLFRRSPDKSVLVHPKTQKNTIHPTMKPVPLLRRIILNSSEKNSAIYDPFGGSGSTLIAAEQTGRRCFMIEMDRDYCQKIVDRFNNLTNS